MDTLILTSMIAPLAVGEIYLLSSLRLHVIGVDQLIECILYKQFTEYRISATAAAVCVPDHSIAGRRRREPTVTSDILLVLVIVAEQANVFLTYMYVCTYIYIRT